MVAPFGAEAFLFFGEKASSDCAQRSPHRRAAKSPFPTTAETFLKPIFHFAGGSASVRDGNQKGVKGPEDRVARRCHRIRHLTPEVIVARQYCSVSCNRECRRSSLAFGNGLCGFVLFLFSFAGTGFDQEINRAGAGSSHSERSGEDIDSARGAASRSPPWRLEARKLEPAWP